MGSGKTYTMFGAGSFCEGIHEDGSINDHVGLAPRAASELFRISRTS